MGYHKDQPALIKLALWNMPSLPLLLYMVIRLYLERS